MAEEDVESNPYKEGPHARHAGQSRHDPTDREKRANPQRWRDRLPIRISGKGSTPVAGAPARPGADVPRLMVVRKGDRTL